MFWELNAGMMPLRMRRQYSSEGEVKMLPLPSAWFSCQPQAKPGSAAQCRGGWLIL